MMNEKDMIRSLFDGCSPDEEQVHRMKNEILAKTTVSQKKGSGKLRLMPAIAAALVMTVCITAIASAPAIKHYFFPGVGIVEVDGTTEAEPLYMMADRSCGEGADFTCKYGVWHDNMAFVSITTETRYDELPAEMLFGDVTADLIVTGIPDLVSVYKGEEVWLSSYHITYTDVTWEEAAAGLPLGTHSITFTRMPAEYQTYAVEDKGMRLELIPLTDDLTTFAAQLSYLDGRAPVYLSQRGIYDEDYQPIYETPMSLIDAEGNTYSLGRRWDDSNDTAHIFAIDETPKAEIVGVRADYLPFTIDFASHGEAVMLEVPLPADGEVVDVNLDFVFPDGKTPGRILSVGYNANRETGEIDRTRFFGMGYRSVLIEQIEQDGILYWCEPYHTDEYNAYLEQYLIEDTRSPYDLPTKPRDPMYPIHMINTINPDKTIEHLEHYIPDGSDTIKIAVNRAQGIVWGDWDIDFDRNLTNE